MKTKQTLLIFLALLLSGCGEGSARQILGMDRNEPDAFAVRPEQPLDVPMDLSSLPPPQPGLGRPNTISPTAEAQSIIVGGYPVANRQVEAAGLRPPSAGEEIFLHQAGATAAFDPNLRAEVNQQAQEDAETQTEGWLSWLVFWRDKPKPGVVVDPKAEADRLRKNAAAGKPATAGGTPVTEESGRLTLPDEIK